MPRNPDAKRCGAKTKNGKPCRKYAIRGRKRCQLHGSGSANRPAGRPETHGMYSERAKRNLQEAIEEYKGDPDLESLDRELAYLKLRFAAMIAPAASAEDDDALTVSTIGGPKDVAAEFCAHIAKLAEKRHRILHGDKYTLTVSHLEPVLRAVDEVLDEFIGDEAARERARDQLQERFARILLPITSA